MVTPVMFLVAATLGANARPRADADYPLQPVPFTAVKVGDAFWSPRLEANRTVTIPYAFRMCEETGRIENFDVAAGRMPGGMRGLYFNDSDVYKVIEGAAYSLAIHPDPRLQARCDGVIARIAAAQTPDGYLYTSRSILDPKNMPPGGKERWSDMGGGHELYCVGHLYEAAVAYHAATGRRELLDVAIRNADLVASVFGPGRNPHPCGHPEIEIGLVKLYRATGERRYLDLARFFIDTRGRPDGRGLYGEYAQDHKPLLEQTEAVGHAVRAAYLFAGMADVAALTGEKPYVDAVARLWNDVVGAKIYLTGGIGSRGNNEGFGDPYELPNSSAYSETCASIANALWNHRLLLTYGDAKYADVLERIVYNGFLAGWSLRGDRFFYPNPLESQRGASRAPWFDCACCPSNVVRFVPSIPGYIYARRANELYVNLFIGGEATVSLDRGAVKVVQQTRYPWDGAVRLTLEPESPGRFGLRIRIPGWARAEALPGDLYRFADVNDEKLALAVNGAPTAIRLDKGYAVIDREWNRGDTIELHLPMPIRRVVANARVRDDAGRIAFQRGPLVYCFEGEDQPEPQVTSFMVADDATFSAEFKPELLGGVEVVTGSARVVTRALDGGVKAEPEVPVTAIPYFAWANRRPSPMTVWVAREPAAARPQPAPTIARRARATSSFGGDLPALSDQMDPASSGDHNNPFVHWWPRKGTQEWVQYDFDTPTRVAGVAVYWFDDTGRGECRLPRFWRLLANAEGRWREVTHPSEYGTAGDRYVTCRFDPVEAAGLRIEVQSQDGWAGGIHEWTVIGADAPTGAVAKAGAPVPADQPRAEAAPVPNASFEGVDGDHPQAWFRSRWGGEGTLEQDRVARTGERSVRISSETGADVSWSVAVPVEMNSRYRIEGWIRTENVAAGTGRGALLNIHNIQPVRTPAVTGTKDWTRVEVEFDTGFEDTVQVNCLLGGWGLSTGTAWYDDVSLTLVSRGRTPAPRITIDASRTGEPISPYIYGQFIEHLGRCIYGGIWAEMLQDRKFFHPVGHAESPWSPLGPASAVSMQQEQAFVGRHSPRITLPGDGSRTGITHGSLALRPGMEYVGHVWLAGDAAVGPVEVTLRSPTWRNAGLTVSIPRLGAEFARHELVFRVDPSASPADDGVLEIAAAGRGSFRVGAVSLMPAGSVQGFRADTLALLRELDSPVYRWPGGNFVSGYDWRDGVGDRDRRPPRKNPAWSGVEHNDVGVDEFLALCAILGTEPYIAVNTGLGGVESAAAELEYVNGPADSPMGRLRAEHGHAPPYGVKFWGIGNEMYGEWQLGHIPLDRYTERHNEFVDAMRKVDPSIKVVGVGAVGDWSAAMLRECAGRMDCISEHVYWQDRAGLLAHVRQAPDSLRRIADTHRRYRREISALAGRDIRICQDEWNYWYGPHVFGELGTRYTMKDALGCAAALNEFARNSDLFFMANYAQTVNVIGAIKTSKTSAALETTGLVLKLYRHHLGVIPCYTEATPTVDAVAAWTADRRQLTIAVVNPTLQAVRIPLVLTGATLSGTGTQWVIADADPMAFNDPDRPSRVAIRESPVRGVSDTLTVEPCGVTLLALDVR